MLGLSERQVNNNSLVKLSIRAIKVCIKFFNSSQKSFTEIFQFLQIIHGYEQYI